MIVNRNDDQKDLQQGAPPPDPPDTTPSLVCPFLTGEL